MCIRDRAKFDESVEIHLMTNADPKNADEQLRTVADLPHGTGKKVRVLVFAEGDAAVSAKEAGADFVSDDEIVKNIEKYQQLIMPIFLVGSVISLDLT